MSEVQKRIVRNSYTRLELILKSVRDKRIRLKLLDQLKAERLIVDATLKAENVSSN